MMRAQDDSSLKPMTRRRWLGLVSAGASVGLCATRPTFALAPDDEAAPLKGRLFTDAPSTPANKARNLAGHGVLDLESGTWTALPLDHASSTRISPDGRFIAYFQSKTDSGTPPMGLYLFDVDGEHETKQIHEDLARPFAWAPDGKSVLFFKAKVSEGRLTSFETWRVSIDGKTRTQLPLLSTDMPLDLSPDGQHVLVTALPGTPRENAQRGAVHPIDIVSLDGKQRTRIIDGYVPEGRPVANFMLQQRFSPDGRHVIYGQLDPKSRRASLWSVGFRGENRKCLVPVSTTDDPQDFCISPDGKSLALTFVTKTPREQGEEPEATTALVFVDIDGKNRRKLRTLPPDIYRVVDWRGR